MSELELRREARKVDCRKPVEGTRCAYAVCWTNQAIFDPGRIDAKFRNLVRAAMLLERVRMSDRKAVIGTLA